MFNNVFICGFGSFAWDKILELFRVCCIFLFVLNFMMSVCVELYCVDLFRWICIAFTVDLFGVN